MGCLLLLTPPPPERTHTGHIYIRVGDSTAPGWMCQVKPNHYVGFSTIWLEKYLSAPVVAAASDPSSPSVVVWRTTYILLYSVGHCKQVRVVVLVDYCRTLFCTFACSTVHTPPNFFLPWPMHKWHICVRVFKALSFHPLNELLCGFHPFLCRKNICDVYLKLTILLLYVRSSHHIRPSVKVDYQMTSQLLLL